MPWNIPHCVTCLPLVPCAFLCYTHFHSVATYAHAASTPVCLQVLKRQKVHLEAARALQFSEEEFMKTLEMGAA